MTAATTDWRPCCRAAVLRHDPVRDSRPADRPRADRRAEREAAAIVGLCDGDRDRGRHRRRASPAPWRPTWPDFLGPGARGGLAAMTPRSSPGPCWPSSPTRARCTARTAPTRPSWRPFERADHRRVDAGVRRGGGARRGARPSLRRRAAVAGRIWRQIVAAAEARRASTPSWSPAASGLDGTRLGALAAAGLRSVQLSVQYADPRGLRPDRRSRLLRAKGTGRRRS